MSHVIIRFEFYFKDLLQSQPNYYDTGDNPAEVIGIVSKTGGRTNETKQKQNRERRKNRRRESHETSREKMK